MKIQKYSTTIIYCYIILGVIMVLCGLVSLLNNALGLGICVFLFAIYSAFTIYINKHVVDDELSIMNKQNATAYASFLIWVIVFVCLITFIIVRHFKPDMNVTPYVFSYITTLHGIFHIILGVKFKVLEDA